MEGLIFAMCFTVLVFVIFGRDEEGRTRFERRKLRKMQQQTVTAPNENLTGSEHLAA